MSSLVGPVRMGQREVKSCNYCYKRKVKCDKTFPCSRCISRGLGDLCEQQTVMVNGRIIGGGKLPSQKQPTLAQVIEENKALHRRINAQEKTIHNLLSLSKTNNLGGAEYAASEEGEGEDDNVDEGDDLVEEQHSQSNRLDLGKRREIGRDRYDHLGGPGHRNDDMEGEHDHDHDQEQESEELGKIDYLSHVNQIYGIDPNKYDSSHQSGNLMLSGVAQSLDTLLNMVPVEYSNHLVRYHCNTLHWIHTVFHQPTFLREHDDWISSIRLGIPIIKSYEFFALYYAIIACSLYFMDYSLASLIGFSQEAITVLPRFWFDTSVNCLQLSNFMVNPTMPVLQTICILPMIAHGFDASKYLGSLMHCALGLARDLDFHLATSATNPEKFGGIIQCELVRRIWWCLTVTDSLRPEAHHPFHICFPTARTSPPANIDDFDLNDHSPIVPRPLTHTTGVTHLLAIERLAALFRDFNQSFSTKTTINAKFKCVREHDARLQSLLDDTPDLKPRLDEIYLPVNSQITENFDYRPWSRYLWSTSLPPSRIMLYRWFLGKSYTDKRWGQAREVCLEAARATLAAHRKPVPALFQKNWHVSSYTVIAGMVIALELINGGHEGQDWDNLRLEVLEVVNFFRSLTTTKSAIITRGITLLEGMVSEAEARLATAVTSHPVIETQEGTLDFLTDGFWPQGIMDHLDNDLLGIFFQQDMTTFQ